MVEILSISLKFMTSTERVRWSALVACRILINLLDVAAVLAMGFLATSTALFITEGSDPSRELEFGGLSLAAVNAQTLPFVASGILIAFLLKALAAIWLTRLTAELVAWVEARAARRVAETVFKADLSMTKGKSPEELMFAIQVGSPSAFNGLLNGLATVFSEGTLFLLVCIGFSLVSLEITLAAVVYFGLVFWLINFFIGTKLGIEAQKASISAVDANAAVGDLVSVFRELSVQGKVDFFIDRLYSSRRSTASSTARQHYLTGMPRYIIESALLVGLALFVLWQTLSGNIVEAFSSIGVFLAGGFRLTAAMLPLQTALLSIKGAIPAAKSVTDFLTKTLQNQSGNLAREREKSSETNSNLESDGQARPVGVSATGLGFVYPGSSKFSIENVSFNIEPGSQVAFIGPSGSGKSTLADLICGLMIPSEGSITLSQSTTSKTNQIHSLAYVPQHPGLVSGTILDNVALGVPKGEINLERAKQAILGAHLNRVVEDLPFGLHSDLGKLKDALSGGEIQRLGLARALYANPGLLVMDEATSALDAESEAEIQKALDEMRGKVTVVLIAHRLNTIQHADQVILLENGQIRDTGTFKQLIARNSSLERVVDLMNVESN